MNWPIDRALTDAELGIAVAQAIINPEGGFDNSTFTSSVEESAVKIGLGGKMRQDQAEINQFRTANPGLPNRIQEHCWNLVILGLLVPDQGVTRFRATERGRSYFESADPTAIIPGALDKVMESLGFEPHAAPRAYARLSQACFLRGAHYEASIVMLGVATEALIELVIAALEPFIIKTIPSFKKRSERPTAGENLSWLREAIEGHHRQLHRTLSEKNQDAGWLEQLRQTAAGTGQAIRLSRNEFGHPTGITATQQDALELLILFPRLARACTAALETLERFPAD